MDSNRERDCKIYQPLHTHVTLLVSMTNQHCPTMGEEFEYVLWERLTPVLNNPLWWKAACYDLWVHLMDQPLKIQIPSHLKVESHRSQLCTDRVGMPNKLDRLAKPMVLFIAALGSFILYSAMSSWDNHCSLSKLKNAYVNDCGNSSFHIDFTIRQSHSACSKDSCSKPHNGQQSWLESPR